MEINKKVYLRNRFDIQVVNAKTGELKQTAIGYNIILDKFFTTLLRDHNPYGLNLIAFGIGTGNTNSARTDLFQSLGSKNATTIATHYDYPTSYITKQIKLEANEYNDFNISEVGLASYSYGLMTHAMLTDAEGNPLTILKTDIDVIYINATFYVTLEHSGFGDNGIYPLVNRRNLISWIVDRSVNDDEKYNSDLNYCVYLSPYKLTNSSAFCWTTSWRKGFRWQDSSYNLASKTMYLPDMTILDSEYNNNLVRSIGIPAIGGFTFPDASIFPDYQIDHLNIGIGDGTTTEFNVHCPEIIPNTAHVYINSTEVDPNNYIFDYNSNYYNGSSRSGSYTATMNCKNGLIEFGSLREESPDTNRYYLDPVSNIYLWDKNFYPNSCTISNEKPIWINLEEPKPCNYFIYDKYWRSTINPSEIIIEYSNDNENWTRVNSQITDQSSDYYFQLQWDSITAQYWRIYSTRSWRMTLTSFDSLRPESGEPRGLYNTGAEINGFNSWSIRMISCISLGNKTPGLKFNTPPAVDDVIEVSYKINVPYKTSNNIIRISCSLTFIPAEYD